MKFVRENIFLVILVAIVLVIGGALLGLNYRFDNEDTARIADRTALTNSLLQFSKGKISEKVVKAQEDQVNTIQVAASQAVEGEKKKNAAAYPVLQMHVIAQGKDQGYMAAFPYDKKKDDTFGLVLIFIEEHRKATKDLLSVLDITTPPTDEEIKVAIERKRSGIKSGQILLDALPGVKKNPDGTIDAEQAAKDLGANEMILRKAALGHMYVEDAVRQEVTFPAGETSADPDVLWRRQYKLWILKDLVASIKAANDEVLGKLSEKERHVPNAPIKHWLGLKIADGYVRGDKSSATPADANMALPLSSGDDITGRFANLDYDVVSYAFRVVMPSRHIPLLIKKLEQDKYHTVLSVQMSAIPQDTKYYYGNDPVLQVTLSCQFLILTSWERELMPAEFLKTLPESARIQVRKAPPAHK